MKKNIAMRLASGLMLSCLLSTCVISGTFAKYTTEATGSDNARVAKWGFTGENANIALTDLFLNAYDNVTGVGSDVIAPGTTNSANFTFAYSNPTAKPEVAYTFTVSTKDSACDDAIKNNPNIKWSLDGVVCDDWDDLLADIQALDGTAGDAGKDYAAGTLPEAFDENQTHTVSWVWYFDAETDGAVDNDVNDTTMGNAATADVTLKITITAVQKN